MLEPQQNNLDVLCCAMANKNFNSADLVHDTVDFIENAELPHPYPALLASFVTEALAPRVAARYIRERHQSEGWQPLVVDWTYIVDCSMHQSQPM